MDGSIVPSLMQSSLMHRHSDDALRKATETYVSKPRDDARVLVVDDEPLIVKAMSDLLQRRGCTVAGAECADDAVDVLKQHSDIGVLVTDIRMPGTHDGRWLIQWVKQHMPNVSIVIVTAFADCIDELREHTDAVFHKPINCRDFAHEITLLLLRSA